MKVLAVAESDAFLKWAAWLLQRAPDRWQGEICLVDSVISPSSAQVVAALVGSGRSPADVPMLGPLAVRRRILRDRPDVVVLAATGRTVAAVCASLLGHRRPTIVAGIPGVGLPVREPAVRSRSAVDLFVAHSVREREEFALGFQSVGAPTKVTLATLPFLTGKALPPPAAGEGRPVFAAQPTVPAGRDARTRLLLRLAATAPPAPIVKLRSEHGEIATHNEPHPYPDLWTELVTAGRARDGDVEFVTGPLADALRQASCLVTVSSTAALEAIDRGRPVLVVDEFGVDSTLLNDVFIGSGLLGPLTRAAIASAGSPCREWAADNYFHDRSDDDWIAAIEAFAPNVRRSRWTVGHPRAIAQGAVRLAAGRWRRRGRTRA